ncbi:MAG: hypothetical protein KDK78_05510 [Chlamydiia bacterium]|nr:hypothetical protein [Chlamydiia bacterium]
MLWILIGFTHSGKSYLGSRVAKDLGLPFHDTDVLLQRVLDPSASLSCRELYQRHGALHFRSHEARVLESLLHTGPALVASGGGSIYHTELLQRFSRSSNILFLDTPFMVIRSRVQSLPAFSPSWEHFEAEYHRRRDLYTRHAHHSLVLDPRRDAVQALKDIIAGSTHGK